MEFGDVFFSGWIPQKNDLKPRHQHTTWGKLGWNSTWKPQLASVFKCFQWLNHLPILHMWSLFIHQHVSPKGEFYMGLIFQWFTCFGNTWLTCFPNFPDLPQVEHRFMFNENLGWRFWQTVTPLAPLVEAKKSPSYTTQNGCYYLPNIGGSKTKHILYPLVI